MSAEEPADDRYVATWTGPTHHWWMDWHGDWHHEVLPPPAPRDGPQA